MPHLMLYIKQVFGLPIDDMHSVGGGAAKESIGAMLGVFEKYKSRRFSLESCILNLIDDYFTAWKKPREFNRQYPPIRDLNNAKTYKMRTAHDLLLYGMIAVLSIEEIRKKIDVYGSPYCKVTDLFMCLVVGLRLIGQTRHDSPSPSDIIFSRECLNTFLRGFIRIYGPEFCTPKNHLLIHLADEAEYFSSHLGGLNAYNFESFLGRIKGGMVKTPKQPLVQVYNGLSKQAYHTDTAENASGEVTVRLKEEALLKAVTEHGSLDLPQWTVFDSNVGPKGKRYVLCHGFEVNVL